MHSISERLSQYYVDRFTVHSAVLLVPYEDFLTVRYYDNATCGPVAYRILTLAGDATG